MTPCQKLQIQEGTARRSESMQQSSATQSLHLSFWGLRKIVACSHSSSQCLLVSAVFGTVSSLHPTSFLMIFILVHVTIVLGDLCDKIGLVGVSAKWSYVTASPSYHDQAIPILSPLLFMHVGHPYIPKFEEFFIYLSCLLF